MYVGIISTVCTCTHFSLTQPTLSPPPRSLRLRGILHIGFVDLNRFLTRKSRLLDSLHRSSRINREWVPIFHYKPVLPLSRCMPYVTKYVRHDPLDRRIHIDLNSFIQIELKHESILKKEISILDNNNKAFSTHARGGDKEKE